MVTWTQVYLYYGSLDLKLNVCTPENSRPSTKVPTIKMNTDQSKKVWNTTLLQLLEITHKIMIVFVCLFVFEILQILSFLFLLMEILIAIS